MLEERNPLADRLAWLKQVRKALLKAMPPKKYTSSQIARFSQIALHAALDEWQIKYTKQDRELKLRSLLDEAIHSHTAGSVSAGALT